MQKMHYAKKKEVLANEHSRYNIKSVNDKDTLEYYL